MGVGEIQQSIDGAGEYRSSSAWSRAIPVTQFLRNNEQETEWLVRDFLAAGSVTLWASPRGLGKTHVAHSLAIALSTGGVFRGERLAPARVLLLDRDNPTREVKRRIQAWGGSQPNDRLKILTREDCPPLTDTRHWSDFPYSEYDVVILDSLSSATEGVEEKDGGKTGKAIAPLLDVARKGPAVLVLANARKDGEVLRGSGVIGDRADVVYEVRDATALRLDHRQEDWIDCLPPASEASWAGRSKRRKQLESYRLAFMVSKFRIGEEPDPIILEIKLPEEGRWSIEDVTTQTVAEFGQMKGEAPQQRLAEEIRAIESVRIAIAERGGIAVRPDAEEIIVRAGSTRNRARQLIQERAGRDWIIGGSGRRNDPKVLLSLSAGMEAAQTPTATIDSDIPIPAALEPVDRPETPSRNATARDGSAIADSGRSDAEENSETPDSPDADAIEEGAI